MERESKLKAKLWPLLVALVLALGMLALGVASCGGGKASPAALQPTAQPTGIGIVPPPAASPGALPTAPLATPASPGQVPAVTPVRPSGPPKIALLLSGPASSRESYRKPFVDAARTLSATVIYDSAETATEQQAQVEDALAQGASVLVIQPADSDQTSAFVSTAHRAGAKVIAYERMINSPDLDLYISFDYRKTGRLQAQAALDWLSAKGVKPPYNFAFLEGAAGDPVAAAITHGYYDVLNPHIDKLEVKISADEAHGEWSLDEALKTTQDVLTTANGNVQAILANNSSMARGALQALAQQKPTGRTAVFVAGADADLENVQAVCEGTEAFEVYKSPELLARRGAAAAVALAKGASVKQAAQGLADVTLMEANASSKAVPMLRVDVKPITVDSVQAELVQSGTFSGDQVGKCFPPLAAGATVPSTAAKGTIALWTQEDESQGVYQYLANLAAQFADGNPGVHVSVVHYDPQDLVSRLTAAAQAGNAPDLVWLGNDQSDIVGLTDYVQATDPLLDPAPFIDSANAAVDWNGRHWGIPISLGHELILFYNKKLLKTPPADTDALLKLATSLTKPDGSRWTLAYDQTNPAQVAMWLGGFKGNLLSDDGRSATLDTPEMVGTLTWLKSLKDKRVAESDTDAAAADKSFKEGHAAMIIADASSLADYSAALGTNLGAARIPPVTSPGIPPAPYSSGQFLLFSKSASGDHLTIAMAFAQFVTSRAIELDMLKRIQRMPALKEALADPQVVNDPLLKAQADQLAASQPLPAGMVTRCAWDSIRLNLPTLLSGKATPTGSAKAMQDAADACIAKLQ